MLDHPNFVSCRCHCRGNLLSLWVFQATAVHEDPAWASHLCEVELSPTRLRSFVDDSPPKPTLHEGDFNNLLVIISHLMLSPLIHPISLSSPNDLNCSGRNSHFAATSTR